MEKDPNDRQSAIENVPSNLYESVCMPDFCDDFFQGAGAPGAYTLQPPDHKVTPVMNGGASAANNNGNLSISASNGGTVAPTTPSSSSYLDGKSDLSFCFAKT